MKVVAAGAVGLGVSYVVNKYCESKCKNTTSIVPTDMTMKDDSPVVMSECDAPMKPRKPTFLWGMTVSLRAPGPRCQLGPLFVPVSPWEYRPTIVAIMYEDLNTPEVKSSTSVLQLESVILPLLDPRRRRMRGCRGGRGR